MRLVQRSSILALASAVALSAAACGGSSSSGDDTTTVNPAGMPHTYVVDSVLLPTKSGEGAKYGLDLDGDGMVDNALGNILTALSSAASGSLNLQASIDDTVLQGKIILLANLKATALDMATGVALEIFVADSATVMPAPCTDPNTPSTCGQHLKGTGMFTVAADSPMDAQIVGKIVGGQFTGGPGTVTLEITLSATAGTPIQLNLIGARAKIPTISDTNLGSSASPAIIAGGVTQSDLDTKVIPAVQTTVQAQIVRDCYDTATPPKPLGAPPGCGCKSGSTGATVISLFDKSPADCEVTLDEIKNNSLIQTLLMPDIMINGTPVLSVGVGVTAVKGTWDVPAGH
jgi:hypothetical protein